MNKIKEQMPVLYHLINMLRYALLTVGAVTFILQLTAGYYIERDITLAIFTAVCAVYWLGVGEL